MKLRDFKGKPGVHLYEGHSYVSRRQLLGAGVIPFAASMVMPTLFDIFLRNNFAQAQSVVCNPVSAGASPYPAILHLNLSGGPLSCQYAVPVGTDNMTALTNASQMGLGTSAATYTTTTMFGNKLMVPTSNSSSLDAKLGTFYQSIAASQTAATLANTTAIVTALQSGNDTSSDTENPAGIISAWAKGLKLPPVTNGGIGQKPALLTSPAPVQVSNVTSLSNQLAPATGALNATLNNAQKQQVYNLAASLSGSQAATLGSMPNANNFTQLMNCAGIQNVQIAQQTPTSVDPRTDPIMQTIYGITANSSANSQAVIEATLVNCALLGLTPLAQMQVGGGDYHGSANRGGDAYDTAAGQIIGRALQAAAAKKVPLYVMTTQDGGMNTNQSAAAGAQYGGDDDQKCTMHLISFNPKAPITASRNWINGFTAGQAANAGGATGFIATDVMSTQAIIANIIHNFTGSTAGYVAATNGISGALTAAQLTAILVI